MTPLLAQAPHGGDTSYAWRPFVTPMPVWDYWFWTLVPLCLAVAVVYKASKVERLSDLPKSAAANFAWILLGMFGIAAGFYALVWWKGLG